LETGDFNVKCRIKRTGGLEENEKVEAKRHKKIPMKVCG
jgi:hypothetical protein